jgi:hypothetical protein
MVTPYSGHAMIGGFHADVDITNVDISGWKGTATNLHRSATTSPETVVTLLEQPRPGWSAHAEATIGEDGVVSLQGTGHFNPERRAAPPARSLWVKKPPPAT